MISRYTVCGCKMPQRYTYCSDSHKASALLFESTSMEEVGAIEKLQELFPRGYSLRLVNFKNPERYNYSVNAWEIKEIKSEEAQAILVSEAPLDFPPDKAAVDRLPTLLFYKGKRYKINLRQRYNECLSLFKAVGCTQCPNRGLDCLGDGVGFTVPKERRNLCEDDEILANLERNYKTLGGFEFVSPSATRTKNEFVSKFRKYWEHSFELIDQNAEELSKRAEKAAVSRTFKRTQCSKCVISNSCDAFRYCKGPYPDLQEIVERSCAEFYTALDKSTWPQWQLWEIANNMSCVSKHSRWSVVLAGLQLNGSHGLIPSVKRARANVREYPLQGYDNIAEVFDLARYEMHAASPVTDPELIATLWLTLNSPNAYRTYGWGNSKYVAGVGVSHRRVSVLWTTGKYLRGVDELAKVSDVAKRLTFGRLAHIEKTTVRRE